VLGEIPSRPAFGVRGRAYKGANGRKVLWASVKFEEDEFAIKPVSTRWRALLAQRETTGSWDSNHPKLPTIRRRLRCMRWLVTLLDGTSGMEPRGMSCMSLT
jgi:hypothetical protein